MADDGLPWSRTQQSKNRKIPRQYPPSCPVKAITISHTGYGVNRMAGREPYTILDFRRIGEVNVSNHNAYFASCKALGQV